MKKVVQKKKPKKPLEFFANVYFDKITGTESVCFLWDSYKEAIEMKQEDEYDVGEVYLRTSKFREVRTK